MTTAERTIYTGTLFILFSLLSPDPVWATLGFGVVLLSALSSSFLIRDFSHIFNHEFGSFFYVSLTLVIIYTIFVHATPDDPMITLYILIGAFIS